MKLADVGEDGSRTIVVPGAVETQDNALHETPPNVPAGPTLSVPVCNPQSSCKGVIVVRQRDRRSH
jgi:hypothetical protein